MARTLVLNASHEPLNAVPSRRAVNLVLQGDAEVLVELEGVVFRSPSVAVPAPLVIKLTTYRKIRYKWHQRPRVTTSGILARDGHRCAYCGKQATTRDHVIPTSRGGRDDWENCVAACMACNNKKGNRLLSELGWKLTVTPRVPQGPLAHRLSMGRYGMHPSWEQYFAQAA